MDTSDVIVVFADDRMGEVGSETERSVKVCRLSD